MRINKFLAQATGLSRRAADQAINDKRVFINGKPAQTGSQVTVTDVVSLDGAELSRPEQVTTIVLHKPTGYVSSRSGQGSRTIYDLLPPELHHLKSVGRLDKDSSGLLLLTNDGQLANELTHPRYAKEKIYEVTLDKPLSSEDKTKLEQSVKLEDGPSHLHVEEPRNSKFKIPNSASYEIRMREGRNRQIRRTFAALGYTVTNLHRTHFGEYQLRDLPEGAYKEISTDTAR